MHQTLTGAFPDLRGRQVHFTAIRIYRIADGAIVESWANQDALGLLTQLRGTGS